MQNATHADLAGTTSACAENTSEKTSHFPGRGNYLRVRGEYISSENIKVAAPELPPRARRILSDLGDLPGPDGTTSACAENTPHTDATYLHAGNYLRVRGEYFSRACRDPRNVELPPRARRIRKSHSLRSGLKGTTSACAENTRRNFA